MSRPAVTSRVRIVEEEGISHTIGPVKGSVCTCEKPLHQMRGQDDHRHVFANPGTRDENGILTDLTCTCGCPTHVKDSFARERGKEVFIPMETLLEVSDQGRWDSQIGKVLLLDSHMAAALEDLGFAEVETRGGWHGTDALRAWLQEVGHA